MGDAQRFSFFDLLNVWLVKLVKERVIFSVKLFKNVLSLIYFWKLLKICLELVINNFLIGSNELIYIRKTRRHIYMFDMNINIF